MKARLGLGLTLAGVAAALAVLVTFGLDGADEPATVQISEVVASSSVTLEAAHGEQPDWIELHNLGDDPVDLAGWFLADDDDLSDAWEIPELEIEPGGHAVLFASGRDEVDDDGHLHTDFAIDRDGEPVVLVSSDGVSVVDRMPPVPIPRNASFGRDPADAARWCYVAFPTPGEANAPECFDDESLGAPLLSASSGLYDDGFDLVAGVPIEVEAIPAPGWEFSHWEGVPLASASGAEQVLLVIDPAGGIELDAVFESVAD